MPWKKARKLIKEDPRYKNFGDSDHVSERISVSRLSLSKSSCNAAHVPKLAVVSNLCCSLLCVTCHPPPYVQRRELEYDKYLRDKMVVAKNEFRALLRETKKITYRLV